MSRKINNSSECALSELDLFSIPPTNTSIEEGGWVEIEPLNSISSGPIEFKIDSTNEYIHLAKTSLFCEVSIMKIDNNKKITDTMKDTDEIGPANNFLHSIFSQVEVSFNGTTFETSNHLYPYKAYMTDLVNYGEDAKKTHMQCALFYKDTPGRFDNFNISKIKAEDRSEQDVNTGYLDRRKQIKNGSVQMIGRIHCDIFNSDRYLLNNIEMKVKFTQVNKQFCLNGNNDSFTFVINKALLNIRKIRINPDIILAHSLALEKTTAKYPIKRVIVKPFTITEGLISTTLIGVSDTILPTRVLIGMIDNDAFTGKVSKNPFDFKHYNLKKISPMINGQNAIYYKPLEPNFTNKDYIKSYYTLFEGIDKPIFASGNDINRDDYSQGNTLFAFDLTPDLCSGNQFNLIKSGNLSFGLEFENRLPNAITVLIYMEFDNMIEISKSRNVFLDYQI